MAFKADRVPLLNAEDSQSSKTPLFVGLGVVSALCVAVTLSANSAAPVANYATTATPVSSATSAAAAVRASTPVYSGRSQYAVSQSAASARPQTVQYAQPATFTQVHASSFARD